MVVWSYPPTARQVAVTAGIFVIGVSFFGVGAYLSFVNAAPQQARAEARSEALRNHFKKLGQWWIKSAALFLSTQNLCLFLEQFIDRLHACLLRIRLWTKATVVHTALLQFVGGIHGQDTTSRFTPLWRLNVPYSLPW
ncbi:hypothetical protein VNO77_15897 [Canavalia gladiata]|uniref:Uncharacterized protein n=1 Tax=Canavalia gladiata TaxID=3824 RepID=A0AAN9M0R6_CANGL